MSDIAMHDGDTPPIAKLSEWTIALNLGPFDPSPGFPSERRVVEALHLGPGLYTVTLEDTPEGASAYSNRNGEVWLNYLFVIVANGEEVGRQTLGLSNQIYASRIAAQTAFNEFDLYLRSFRVTRVSTVLIHPILAGSGNRGQLKVRIQNVRIRESDCSDLG